MLNKKWESLTTEFLKKWEKNYNKQCHQINRNGSFSEKIKTKLIEYLRKRFMKT